MRKAAFQRFIQRSLKYVREREMEPDVYRVSGLAGNYVAGRRFVPESIAFLRNCQGRGTEKLNRGNPKRGGGYKSSLEKYVFFVMVRFLLRLVKVSLTRSVGHPFRGGSVPRLLTNPSVTNAHETKDCWGCLRQNIFFPLPQTPFAFSVCSVFGKSECVHRGSAEEVRTVHMYSRRAVSVREEKILSSPRRPPASCAFT